MLRANVTTKIMKVKMMRKERDEGEEPTAERKSPFAMLATPPSHKMRKMAEPSIRSRVGD